MSIVFSQASVVEPRAWWRRSRDHGYAGRPLSAVADQALDVNCGFLWAALLWRPHS